MISRPAEQDKSSTSGQTMTPGERLRVARGDLSLRALSERLAERGITRGKTALQEYETDVTIPQIDVVVAICELTGTSPLWVLVEQGPPRWDELPDWISHPELHALRAAIDRLALGAAEAPARVRESTGEYMAERGRHLANHRAEEE